MAEHAHKEPPTPKKHHTREPATDRDPWTFTEQELRNHPSHPRFALRDFAEREHAIMLANGAPSLAEWLGDARAAIGRTNITREDILTALRESRDERDERIESWLR